MEYQNLLKTLFEQQKKPEMLYTPMDQKPVDTPAPSALDIVREKRAVAQAVQPQPVDSGSMLKAVESLKPKPIADDLSPKPTKGLHDYLAGMDERRSKYDDIWKEIRDAKKGKEMTSDEKMTAVLLAAIPTLGGLLFGGGLEGLAIGANAGKAGFETYEAGRKEKAKEQKEDALKQAEMKMKKMAHDDDVDLKAATALSTLENNQYNRDLKERELGLKAKELDRKAAEKASKPGVFETQKLKKFADSAVEWTTKDRAQLTTNLGKIDDAVGALSSAVKSGDSLFGPVKGSVPDFVRKFTNEKAISVRESMHSAIQDTLRPTLGAQFTEKEGVRIMNLAINPNLSDEENLKRAKGLQEAISKKVRATDALYKYIEENGTDKGFPYEKFDMRKVESEVPQAGDFPRQVRKGGQVATVSNEDELKEALSEGWQ